MSVASRLHSTPVPHAVSPRLGPAVRRYTFAVLVVGLALGLRWLLHGVLGEQAPFLLFVPAVLLASWRGGLGPGLVATALSSIAVSYAFLAPLGILAVNGTAALVQLALFTGIGVTISLLSGRLRGADARAGRRLQALEASEERFRLLVEGVEDYAIYMLDPEGRIVLWNRGAERIKGYRSEEVLGRPMSLFYPPEEREAAGRHLQEAAERGHTQEEGVRVRKDGSRFWAHVTLTALRDAQGNLRGFAKITRDITARRQAEEEIRLLADTLEQRVIQRTAQLEEANQALQAFAYSVSHDLRAPLRAMQGFSEALLEDYGDRLEETGRDYARRIVAASERMDRLISDLLAYSRLSRAEMVPQTVSLRAALEEACQGLAADLRARGAEIRLDGDLPAVKAHRATLVQALINLFSNAVTYVAPGVAPRVRVWAEPRGGRVRLWVEDNGIGVAPEHHDRIFRVFERLHGVETYAGTGVGLAIVRKGLERMGGQAGVESLPGAGSRFWIELPPAEERA